MLLTNYERRIVLYRTTGSISQGLKTRNYLAVRVGTRSLDRNSMRTRGFLFKVLYSIPSSRPLVNSCEQTSWRRFGVFYTIFLGDVVHNPQSNKKLEGPLVSSALYSLKGEFTSAQEHCLIQNWYSLAISLACPNGEERGNLIVQMISTCRHKLRGRGRGSAPCGTTASFYLICLIVVFLQKLLFYQFVTILQGEVDFHGLPHGRGTVFFPSGDSLCGEFRYYIEHMHRLFFTITHAIKN